MGAGQRLDVLADPIGAVFAIDDPVSVLAVVLIACAVLLVIGAEWPRLRARAKANAEPRVATRRKSKSRAQLRVIQGDNDDFAESVRRDLDRLPTIDDDR
jgi:hypothetical protein